MDEWDHFLHGDHLYVSTQDSKRSQFIWGRSAGGSGLQYFREHEIVYLREPYYERDSVFLIQKNEYYMICIKNEWQIARALWPVRQDNSQYLFKVYNQSPYNQEVHMPRPHNTRLPTVEEQQEFSLRIMKGLEP